jgi:hypothetical protein
VQSPDTRRITLISRHKKLPERNWHCSVDASSRIVMVDSLTVLRYTLANPLLHIDADVERIVLDRSSSASESLALLAELPHEFNGDVVMIREDEGGFLSAMGRGGDRILYAFSALDLRFYLETNSLLDPNSEPLPLPADVDSTVLQFRPRAIAAVA